MKLESLTLTQERVKTFLNDPQRKELFKRLFDLYANTMPTVIKLKDDFMCVYPIETEKLADKIKQQISLRDNQIFNSFEHEKIK
jgi:hypothetical protein